MDSGTPCCRCCSGFARRTASGKTGETCETSAQTSRKASTPHPAGQACADFCRCRAGSALRQAPRAPEARTSGDSPSAPHRRLRPMSEKPTGKATGRVKPTQGEEKSMLLKWKPPQIVNSKDDDSLEAVVIYERDQQTGKKNEFTGRSVNRLRHQPGRKAAPHLPGK